jgi:hypothetical protein
MSTKILTTDLRHNEITFKDIAVGSMFTEPEECIIPYIKMPIFKIVVPKPIEEVMSVEQKEYNAITLDGEPYWFGDNIEVNPISEISIIMK